jgi:hypothetical protein
MHGNTTEKESSGHNTRPEHVQYLSEAHVPDHLLEIGFLPVRLQDVRIGKIFYGNAEKYVDDDARKGSGVEGVS